MKFLSCRSEGVCSSSAVSCCTVSATVLSGTTTEQGSPQSRGDRHLGLIGGAVADLGEVLQRHSNGLIQRIEVDDQVVVDRF